MLPKNPTVKHIKKTDGTVWRDGVCECGNKVYKKNLTTGEIEFLIKRDRPGFYEHQVIKPLNNPSANEFTCSKCGLKHIVADI
jgi:Uncharacterized protein conserved in bacteria